MAEAGTTIKTPRTRKPSPPPMATEEMAQVLPMVAAKVLEIYQQDLGISLDEDLEKRCARQLRKELRKTVKDLEEKFFSLSDSDAQRFAERIAPYVATGDGPTPEELMASLDHTAFIQQLPEVAGEALNGAILRSVASLSDNDREMIVDGLSDDLWATLAGNVRSEIREAEDRGKDRVNDLISKSDIRLRPKNAFHEIKLDIVHAAERPVGTWHRTVPAGTVGFFGFELARQTVLSDQIWAQHWAARVAAPIVAIFAVELLAWGIRHWASKDDTEGEKKGEKKGKKTEE